MLVALELLLLALGVYLLARTFGPRERREAFFARARLQHWELSGPEVTLLVVCILLLGACGQSGFVRLFATTVQAAHDRAGLELAVYGTGFHGIALLAWPVFFLLRRHLCNSYGVEPAQAAPATPPADANPLSWPAAAAAAGRTLVVALPLVAAVSYLWTHFLHLVGLPEEPQDLLAVFQGTRSPVVLAGMVTVACVLAPMNEELLFRGAIFRFLRQRFHRAVALTFSAVFFGAMHGNWAGAAPLAVLGIVLALAYERTGDIRVPIIAHALFNLNTILVLLAGFSP